MAADSHPKIQKLIDPETGQSVHLVYAIPPELLTGGTSGSDEDGISLADLAQRLWRGRLWIIGATVIAAVIGVAVALSKPNVYTSEVTALPPSKDGGGLGQYAQLAAMAGINLPTGPASSSDEIIAILESRRLRDRLIEEFKLQEYYNAEFTDDALAALKKDLTVSQDKRSNQIKFAATNQDPAVAQKIAQRSSELLQDIFNDIHQSTARRERLFLETRLAQTDAAMHKATEAMATFQRDNHAFQIEAQTTATVEALAKLQGELIAQQIELRALLASSVSEDNPQVQLLQQRVAALADQLDQLVTGTTIEGGVLMGLGGLPELAIQYISLLREVKKGEAMITVLTGQLEAARVNEVRNSEAVTIVDPAPLPQRKSGPKRSLICVAATMLGAMFGAALALWQARPRIVVASDSQDAQDATVP